MGPRWAAERRGAGSQGESVRLEAREGRSHGQDLSRGWDWTVWLKFHEGGNWRGVGGIGAGKWVRKVAEDGSGVHRGVWAGDTDGSSLSVAQMRPAMKRAPGDGVERKQPGQSLLVEEAEERSPAPQVLQAEKWG